MKTIFCAVKEGKYIKEYVLSYEEQDVNEFLEGLDKTVIMPTTEDKEAMFIKGQLEKAERFDKQNTLNTYEDIKVYIRELHVSSNLDLTKLNILLNSTSEMRNPEVCTLFRNFLNLYTYKDTATYEAEKMPQIIRKMYELGMEDTVPHIDSDIIVNNTEALYHIGFSIESRINEQSNQKIKK